MEMDMDVASGKIKLVEGRMIKENETDVCVVSDELAKLNSLKPGDELQFNNAKDKENSQEYSAKIVGIYKTTQKIKPVMSCRFLQSLHCIPGSFPCLWRY